jgi:hypothetical protein
MPRIPCPPSAPAGNGDRGSGGGGGNGGNSTTIPNTSNAPIVYYQTPMTTEASEFAHGGKHSLSDYEKLTNKDQWHRWQQNLMGTAFEHKCENVLDPSYVPDPLDTDECELFDLQ